MDRQDCPNCGHVGDLMVHADDDDMLTLKDRNVFFGNLPTTVTCGRCGWVQFGFIADMEVSGDGRLVGGDYQALTEWAPPPDDPKG